MPCWSRTHRHQPYQPARSDLVRRQVRELRAEVAVQADELELGMGEHPLRRVCGGARAQREAELLVLDASRQGLVRMGVDTRRDPDEDPLPHRRLGREPNDLRGASITMRPTP